MCVCVCVLVCVCVCVSVSVSAYDTASHQTFGGQYLCWSSHTQFDLTHILYMINGKFIIFIKEKGMFGQILYFFISTGVCMCLCVCCVSMRMWVYM